MYYLHFFNTDSEYQAKKGDLITPSVSYVEGDTVVYYQIFKEEIPDNEIWYTTTDDQVMHPHILNSDMEWEYIYDDDAIPYFGASCTGNRYENGKGILTFDGPVIKFMRAAYDDSCPMDTPADCRLQTLILPNSVTYIDGYSINSCHELTSVNLGSGVTYIGDSALYNCDNLTAIYCKAILPPNLEEGAFEDNAPNRKIYIPAQSFTAYKNATNWREYIDDIVPE